MVNPNLRITLSLWGNGINKGNKLKPAAAGEETPTKYILASMGLDVK